jgi:hypothetical protein
VLSGGFSLLLVLIFVALWLPEAIILSPGFLQTPLQLGSVSGAKMKAALAFCTVEFRVRQWTSVLALITYLGTHETRVFCPW